MKTLSVQEEKVLQLMYEGYQGKDIASKMERSPKTISTYKKRAAYKLLGNEKVNINHYNDFTLVRSWLVSRYE